VCSGISIRKISLANSSLVYSVADYLDEHPGGEQILLDTAGTDATTAFEDIGHSEDAREKLAKYVIGVLPLSVSYDLFP
jgi:cytochrome-b5 reductase